MQKRATQCIPKAPCLDGTFRALVVAFQKCLLAMLRQLVPRRALAFSTVSLLCFYRPPLTKSTNAFRGTAARAINHSPKKTTTKKRAVLSPTAGLYRATPSHTISRHSRPAAPAFSFQRHDFFLCCGCEKQEQNETWTVREKQKIQTGVFCRGSVQDMAGPRTKTNVTETSQAGQNRKSIVAGGGRCTHTHNRTERKNLFGVLHDQALMGRDEAPEPPGLPPLPPPPPNPRIILQQLLFYSTCRLPPLWYMCTAQLLGEEQQELTDGDDIELLPPAKRLAKKLRGSGTLAALVRGDFGMVGHSMGHVNGGRGTAGTTGRTRVGTVGRE